MPAFFFFSAVVLASMTVLFNSAYSGRANPMVLDFCSAMDAVCAHPQWMGFAAMLAFTIGMVLKMASWTRG